MLDARVEYIFHVGQTRMRHDGTIPQRTRSPLGATLEPSYDVAFGNLSGHCFEQRRAFHFLIAQINSLPLATLFSAQPPAIAKFGDGTCLCNWLSKWKNIPSNVRCMANAKSMSRCVISVWAWRGGPNRFSISPEKCFASTTVPSSE